MCLAAFSLLQSERFPFVLASNRDEFFDRAALPMHWWPGSQPAILAGRDLDAGGAWLGLSDRGRLALLTNIRCPREHRYDAASRGALVLAWLNSGQTAFADFWTQQEPTRFNGFNLLAFDFGNGVGHHGYASSRHTMPRSLAPGLYGLSNAELDTPWPKVERLKSSMQTALRTAQQANDLVDMLLPALADTRVAADGELPSTGVPLDVERELSAVHVNALEGRYGTRCSTLVICERHDAGLRATVIERSFHPDGAAPTQTRFTLPVWPAEPGQG